MQIIPVIDLQNDVVVHAKQGNRESYAPLKSKICETTDIFNVIFAFKKLFGFQSIYIADLNAICRKSPHSVLLNEVLHTFPEITFWIDSGYPLPNPALLSKDNYWPVLGSESFSEDTASAISTFNKRFILSLDYGINGQLGAKTLFSNTHFWPEDIIIMSLPNVGSNRGPDLATLERYRNNYPNQNFIAAGGVRNKQDLINLSKLGIHTCLIASALHNGEIRPEDNF